MGAPRDPDVGRNLTLDHPLGVGGDQEIVGLTLDQPGGRAPQVPAAS